MDLLRISTDDYNLTVRTDSIESTFRRASLRNANIESATTYSFAGGNIKKFEIIELEHPKGLNQLISGQLNIPSHPVFFENKDYYFDIEFKTNIDNEPLAYNKLQDIKKSFIVRKINGYYFVTGAINYQNDIGKADFEIRYQKNGTTIKHIFNYEVFPIKLDYNSDYKSILLDINNEFSSLIFDFLRKTYLGFKDGNQTQNDIIWWGVFGQLYDQIILNARLILNKPHNRLINEKYHSKADQIKTLNYLLEESVIENKSNENKYYLVEKKTLTVNTPENQFFKYVLGHLLQKFKTIKRKLLSIYSIKITTEFAEILDKKEKELSTLFHHPFFKHISDFSGLKQESLVLQKASGYSTLFRTWIILKRGISFLEGVNKIELKSIDRLYQVWCFIEMKNMIQAILNKQPLEVDLAELLIDGFTVKLKSGRNSKISFQTDEGTLVELFHELKYVDYLKDNTLTHTVNQEPDIVLRITKNEFNDSLQLTYLFDAKYRVKADDKENEEDYPPDDAINQMHRYRDAIYYQNSSIDNKPKKEVIGAFVLFPGAENEINTKQRYFYKSIDKVNIGAYPLIPGNRKTRNNNILLDFLKSILIEKDSLNVLENDIIPYKGLKYEEPDALVLAGFLGSESQKSYFNSGKAKIYHIPVKRANGKNITIKYLNQLKYFSPIINGISEYYRIKDIKVIPRKEIFNKSEVGLYKDSDDPYFVFELEERKMLNKKIESSVGGNRVFRYAKLSELNSSSSINEFRKVSQIND
ncbi:MAG: DUF2357 domain-containing protein [Bacteroidetes bacterium]|nr:DUF2357 domain-containing protein [Bacteroidota bacterium]